MPLTDKGNEIKENMQKEYGKKKGEQVFYASKNKGTISGVDEEPQEEEQLIGLHGGGFYGMQKSYAPVHDENHRKRGLNGIDEICKK